MATMRDVAAKAGVSMTTVSHVINQTRFVSEDLETRVREAIEELGYQPDHRARSLRRGNSETIAVVVSDVSNPFFPQVVRGIEDCARENGYSVLLTNTDENPELEGRNLDLMIERRVDGFIIAPTTNALPRLERVTSQSIPVVVIDRQIDMEIDQVFSDNEQAAYAATRALLELGHTKIGTIVELVGVASFDDRLAGYRRAMAEAGYESDLYVRQAGLELAGAYAAAKSLLSGPQPVTAIFGTNNLMTLGVLNYLKESGIGCPECVSVVGFDDPDWAVSFTPSITSIAQQPYEMGFQAASMLISRIEGDDSPARRVCLPCELRIRESSGECREKE